MTFSLLFIRKTTYEIICQEYSVLLSRYTRIMETDQMQVARAKPVLKYRPTNVQHKACNNCWLEILFPVGV